MCVSTPTNLHVTTRTEVLTNYERVGRWNLQQIVYISFWFSGIRYLRNDNYQRGNQWAILCKALSEFVVFSMSSTVANETRCYKQIYVTLMAELINTISSHHYLCKIYVNLKLSTGRNQLIFIGMCFFLIVQGGTVCAHAFKTRV